MMEDDRYCPIRKAECKGTGCEICGKSYETYPIILCDNPLCFASFLEEEQKPDGTMRTICKECRDKLRG